MSGTVTRSMMALGVVALLAGCAPVVVTPGTFAVGVAPGSGVTASQCTMLGGSPEAARMGVRSSAIQAAAVLRRIQHLQARMSFGSTTPNPESWRRIATGEC